MIKILKLAFGEEIVGNVIYKDSETYHLKDVYVIMYRFHPYSVNPTVKLVPYMMFGKDNTFTFKHTDITNDSEAREAFCEYYNAIVKTNEEKNQSKLIDDELKTAVGFINNNSKESMYTSILENFEKTDNVN